MSRQRIYQIASTLVLATVFLAYTNCAPGFKVSDGVSNSISQTSSQVPSGTDNGSPTPTPVPPVTSNPTPTPSPTPSPTPTPVYPADPVATGTQVEQVACDFGATEGPSWSPQNFLVFTDWINNRVYKYFEETKQFTIFVSDSDILDGTTYDKNGDLISARGGQGRNVVRINSAGQQTVLASRYQGKRFNGLNDVAIFSDNSIYVTDTGQQAEINFTGVYRVRPNGQVDLVDSTLNSPNGLGFSPDYKRLYVTGGESVYQFDVAVDGSVSNKRLFYSPPTNTGGFSNQDGLAVDAAGNVYITFHSRVWVVNPSGKLITFIQVPSGYLTNVAFGSKDLKTLYITSSGCVYKIRTLIPGMPFG